MRERVNHVFGALNIHDRSIAFLVEHPSTAISISLRERFENPLAVDVVQDQLTIRRRYGKVSFLMTHKADAVDLVC